MKKLLLIVAVVGAMLAVSATAQAGTWPAHCKTMKCVNKHLNALHKTAKANAARDHALAVVVNDLISTNPPTNNVLQGEIDSLQAVDSNQNQNLNTAFNQLACFNWVSISRFVSGVADQNTWSHGSNLPSSNNGVLDFENTNQAVSGHIYPFVINGCVTP